MPGKIFTLKFVYEISTADLKRLAIAPQMCPSVVHRWGGEQCSTLDGSGEIWSQFPADPNFSRFKSEQSSHFSPVSCIQHLHSWCYCSLWKLDTCRIRTTCFPFPCCAISLFAYIYCLPYTQALLISRVTVSLLYFLPNFQCVTVPKKWERGFYRETSSCYSGGSVQELLS